MTHHCRQCGKGFRKSAYLGQHKRVVHDDRPRQRRGGLITSYSVPSVLEHESAVGIERRYFGGRRFYGSPVLGPVLLSGLFVDEIDDLLRDLAASLQIGPPTLDLKANEDPTLDDASDVNGDEA